MHCHLVHRHVFSLAILTALLCCLSPASTHARDELLTQAPSEYRAFGVVKDQQGHPIVGAKASLVSLQTEPVLYQDLLYKTPAVTTATCDLEGKFDIRIAGTDKRWDAINDRSELLLLVEAPGYATSVRKFNRSRLLVNLPFDIPLDPCDAWQLKVIDQAGEPVSDVTVSVGQIDSHRLPFKLDVLQPVTDSGTGLFSINGVTRESLSGVFVSSKKKGNFFLGFESKGNLPVVRIPQTGVVKGIFELADRDDTKALTGSAAIFTSGNLYASPDASKALSWAIVAIDENASASAPNLSLGPITCEILDPYSVPFCPSMKDYKPAPTLTADNSPLELRQKLYPVEMVKLRIENEDGEPIPTVQTYAFGDIRGGDDVDGEFLIPIAAGEKPSGQLFPYDSTGKYLITGNFGVILDRLQRVNGEYKPIIMTRSRSLQGTVTDEQGKPIAGAKIEYSVQVGSSTLSQSTLSNLSGDFRIDGLPPNASVTLKANRENLATPGDTNISAMSGSPEPVIIPVVAQRVAAIAGMVTDQQGNPLAGAKVKLFRAVAFQPEGYQAERLQAVDLIPEYGDCVTDATGSFRYPSTTRFAERIQVSVTAPNFRPQRFPFINGSLKEVGEQTIQLGSFPLFKLPKTRSTTVTVVDKASGDPVEKAKLVFVGIDTTKQIATTDSQGIATLNLADTNQLLAVKANDYQLNLASFKNIPATIEVSLESQNDPQPLPWTGKPWQAFHGPTSGLLQQLEIPQPKESTYYRQTTFFKSQLNTDFAAFKKAMLVPGYEHQQSILMINSGEIFLHAPRESYQILRAAPLPAGQKAALLAQFALLSTDEEFKEELYGEAIVQSAECTGQNQLFAIGQIASPLIIDGQIDVAKELVSETWESAKELREILESEQASPKVGESRVFAPVLGLIDADTGIKLIRLTAREIEISGLIAQCAAYASLAGDQDIDAICKKHDVTFDATGIENLTSKVSTTRTRYDAVAAWIQEHVDKMPDSTAKIGSILFAARHLPPGQQRTQLIHKAAIARKACNPSYHWDDPAKPILEELPKFDSITTSEFDDLLFAVIEHAPPKTDSMQLNGVYANLIKMLAVRDPDAASNLLEPAFENGTWLYGDPNWSAFSDNSLLKAWSWIDPKLAFEKALELSDRYSDDDPVRKLQLLTTVINELNTIATGKGMLQVHGDRTSIHWINNCLN